MSDFHHFMTFPIVHAKQQNCFLLYFLLIWFVPAILEIVVYYAALWVIKKAFLKLGTDPFQAAVWI